MKKILRLSLIAILSLICGTGFAQTTFDIDNDYATLFPNLPGTSSNDSHDGDFTEATTCTIDGISITVSAKTSGNNENRIWTSSPRLRMYTGTLTITAPEGKNISGVEFNAGKWNENNTVDNGELNAVGSNATWTGSSNSVVLNICGNTQIKSIVVYLEGETPEPIVTAKYKKADKIESGKEYLIVALNDGIYKVAQQITSNYGYLYVEDAKEENGVIELSEDNTNAFTVNATDGGYTIKQNNGKYLYQSGTYNSFNVSENPTEGQVWTIDANADGTFKITNVGVNKYVQYSAKYTSFGSYADEQGIMPYLYVKDETGTSISNTTADKFDANAPVYNLAGQRVSKNTKGILIQNGKKFVNK
ncbi:RICIN domain-containing protein [uncultured Prevotella sp.]|uniref:RICIN domain-containing protein n=1 Tax=uncultured Prevotella sp. TaxID=159272 RepID=UPI002604779B|nr:RICIN domain-containing protein [uncultured Prevotella sp.]